MGTPVRVMSKRILVASLFFSYAVLTSEHGTPLKLIFYTGLSLDNWKMLRKKSGFHEFGSCGSIPRR